MSTPTPLVQHRYRVLELVGCWHTPTNIGEMVTVTVVFRMESWADWERIRYAGVRDPLMGTWVEKRRALLLAGSRRFYESASFSPWRLPLTAVRR